MAAYYSGPRVRLPSNRSLQLSDSSSSPPHPPPQALAPILIFPTPSSEPASPHPTSLHSRARTSSSLAHGPLRLRHARVDSNASSASLIVCSSVTDLGSPLSANSPRLARSSLHSTSDWEELEAVSGPSTASGMVSSPLTRERIVRLGSARVVPCSSWRSGSGETPSVEMWEWTSTGSEVDADREPWPEDETNYEDALSHFHFPTLEQSRMGSGVGGVQRDERTARAVLLPSRSRTAPNHPSLGQRAIELPLRFVLETVLGISPATLMLLERGTHEPATIDQTGLFGAVLGEWADQGNEVGEAEAMPRGWPGTDSAASRTVKEGIGALAEANVGLFSTLPLPLGVSICMLASIPRRVWTSLAGIPKLRG